MMVLSLILNLILNLNLVVLNVKTSPDTVMIVTVTKKGRSRLILSYRIATLGLAQIAAVIHSLVMVVKNVTTEDLMDPCLLMVPQMAVAVVVAAVNTMVILPSVPRTVAFPWEEWAESSVSLKRTPEMLRWKVGS